MKKQFFILSLLLCLCTGIFAQQKITGVVKNNGGVPLAGVTITLKGTNRAVISDSDGSFNITAKPGDVLVFSYIGYNTREIKIVDNTSLRLFLSETISNLDEVIVTGYTSQKKKEITGAVAVVSMKDMKSIPASSPEQMLQGQAAGLNVITSGNPGDNSNIYIRGITSFNATNPLIVVDGVPSAPNDLSMLHDLSPNDVESVQVLKDGQAAIYGARGSAGVILITTKKGKSGKATITYDMYYGTQRPLSGNVWHNLDPQGNADLYFLAAFNSLQVDANGNVVSAQYGTGQKPVLPDYILAGNKSGVPASDSAVNPALYNIDYSKGDIYQIVAANKSGTDWYHEVFKPAPIQSHSLTASGGNDRSAYLFSVNYFNQQGTLLNTYLKRYAARMNTSFVVKNNIRLGENLYVFYKDNSRIWNNIEGNEVLQTAWEHPIIPPYDIKGGFGGNRGNELGNTSSPLAARVRATDDRAYNWAAQGNAWAELDFLRHFTTRTSFGGNIDNYSFYFHGYHTYEQKENSGSNSFGEGAGHSANWTWTNTLSYNNVFGKHSVKVLAGIEAAQYTGREVGGQRFIYFSDDPNYLNLSTGGAAGQTNYSFFYKSTLYSLLSRIDYAYNDEFFLGLSGRRDQSSVLSPDTRTGYFWAVSGGWMVTKEDFMKSSDWLSSLKLRGSYGKLGSISNTTGANSFTTYTSGVGTTYYPISGLSSGTSAIVRGFAYATLGNPKTSWEEDVITNVGFDATLLSNRLSVSFDWYEKKINGLLFPDQPPGVVGGANRPNVNIGDMKNTGLDIVINYHGKIGKDWDFNIGTNITTYNNTIVSIPGSAGFFTTATTHNSGDMVRNQTGQVVGAFYGYKVVGIYQDAADVAKWPAETDAAPGRFKYLDANGDGQITTDDRVFFGDPNPDFTFGLNLGLAYKGFDFSAVFYSSIGNDIWNYTRYFQDFYPQFQNAKAQNVLTGSWIPKDRSLPRSEWTAVNPNASYPIAENNSYFCTNGEINDFLIEDGSYFRCKQMQIGYTIPGAKLKRLGIHKARIYIQAANLFTITDYTGLDPELGTQGNSTSDNASFGIDWGNYPSGQKMYLIGVSISF